jgi:hypothetical protein
MSGAVEVTFAHAWEARVLAARPMILPARHYVYPSEAEEVERGALEVTIRPGAEGGAPVPQEFLATCALGFRDPLAPTGIWAAPNAEEICCVSGGYAYVIDTVKPERFTFLPLRPVLEVRAGADPAQLLFVGHRHIAAWGAEGLAWESEKLSDEGIAVGAIEGGRLHGRGWNLMTDREIEFVLDLRTGLITGL